MADTIFIFCLALIIFGPKKLPEIGRQIGKLMVEFRRASNEFKMQIEEELRASEEAERQKEISAKTTMLPIVTTASTIESVATPELAASTSGAETATPLIAPPSIGVPVNRTFNGTDVNGAEATAGTCSYEAIPDAAHEAGAWPEPGNGFNPGLNTASNGEIAEVPTPEPAIAPAIAPSASILPEAPAAGLNSPSVEATETAVHHG